MRRKKFVIALVQFADHLCSSFLCFRYLGKVYYNFTKLAPRREFGRSGCAEKSSPAGVKLGRWPKSDPWKAGESWIDKAC